jgi:hypothetical protein
MSDARVQSPLRIRSAHGEIAEVLGREVDFIAERVAELRT